MTEPELIRAEQQAEVVCLPQFIGEPRYVGQVAADVRALVAEVRRLRQELSIADAGNAHMFAAGEDNADQIRAALHNCKVELADVQAERDRLREALVGLAVFADPNATARWDDLAERFYRATGIMAPGKSVAPEMANSQPPDDVREDQYRKWLTSHLANLHAQAIAALDFGRGPADGERRGGSKRRAGASPAGRALFPSQARRPGVTMTELEERLNELFETCRSGSDRLNVRVMAAITEAARIGAEVERAAIVGWLRKLHDGTGFKVRCVDWPTSVVEGWVISLAEAIERDEHYRKPDAELPVAEKEPEQ